MVASMGNLASAITWRARAGISSGWGVVGTGGIMICQIYRKPDGLPVACHQPILGLNA